MGNGKLIELARAFDNEVINVQRTVEQTINERLDIMERRILKAIEGKVDRPADIQQALYQHERGKELNEKLTRVTDKVSVLYAKASSPGILSEDKERLTDEGQKVYASITETLTEVSRYLGYKSVTKVANARLYAEFAEVEGLKPLKKRTAYVKGKGVHSVFSDLMFKEILPDYLRFIERRFLTE